MIDYLIVYPDDATRASVFPAPEDAPYAPCWSTMGGTAMPVRIVVSDGDEETPAIYAPGSWMAIRTAERSPDIEAMPNTMLATDSDLASQGVPYVHFCRLQPETLLGYVSPTFSGDGYLIPAGQPASALDAWLIA